MAAEKKQETVAATVPPVKRNHHVAIALRHLNERRKALLEKRAQITTEIEELDAAILALE